MSEKTILKIKKYTMLDYLRIPFKACPFVMSVIGLNRIIVAFIPAITALVTAKFIDNSIAIYSGKIDRYEIIFPIVCFILIHIYTNINLAFIYNFMNVRYDMAINRYVTTDLIKKRGRLKYEYIEDDDTWNLISRTCDDALFYIAQGMNNIFNIMEVIIKIASVVVILMTQVWWVGIIILVIMLPMIPVAQKSGREIYNAKKNVRKYIRRYQYLSEVINGRDSVEERLVYDYSNSVNEKWFEHYEDTYKILVKSEIDRNVKMKITGLITLVVSVSIVGVLLIPTFKGQMGIGMFVALATATFDLVSMMANRVAVCTRKYAMQKTFLDDLTEFMSLPEQEGATDLPIRNENFAFESIVFDNVTFKYPNTDKYVLKDFSIRIEKNKHYSIVGINGAGKTTFTKLLTGLYDDYSGNIYINGKNLKEYRLGELKSIFSVIYQDFAKYQINVGDNIRLGDVGCMDTFNDESEKKINKIICDVDLENVIGNMPYGINTNLGKIEDESVDISGGQWQRLAMARLLYNPAQVRILDEPTASLDPMAESKMYETFGKINRGKTTIFITHRLGAAKLADEIIVIGEGKVLERGTHEFLMKKAGVYSEMFESQRKWYLNDINERNCII